MKVRGAKTIMGSPFHFENMPPELAQQILRHLNGKDLLACRLVSTFVKAQTDKVIGYKSQDEGDPNLIWNPRHITQLKCNYKENFLVQVAPGTTVVKTQKQIKMFLQFASQLDPSSPNPFQNGALIYRAASRMRIPLLCANRDIFVVFDRPVDGLTNLLFLYGQYLTSFVFDCKNQAFYQYLTAQDLSKLLQHLPHLKFLGINAPFKFGLEPPPGQQVSREQEVTSAKKMLPALPCLQTLSLGDATSAYCCRGYGTGLLAWELILGVYGNQIKSLTFGGGGTIPDLGESYARIFCEEDPAKQITFESLENLKIFDCVTPFDLLHNIAISPVKQWNLKRLSLQMRRCRCSHKKEFSCPLSSWSKSIPNMIMLLMTRFESTLEELYFTIEEKNIDVMHWIYPAKYEWNGDKQEETRKFMEGIHIPCKALKKVSIPSSRLGTRVMLAILRRCVALEELSLLKGTKRCCVQEASMKWEDSLLADMWSGWPMLQKINVIRVEDFKLLHKHTRKPA